MIDRANLYLSQRFGVSNWFVSPVSINTLSGLYQASSGNTLIGLNSLAMTELAVGGYIYYNGRAGLITRIVNNSLVYIDRYIDTFNSPVVMYSLTNGLAISNNEINLVKALTTAENQIKYSKEYILPATYTENIIYGISEWALWLVNGGSNSNFEDRRNGLIRKTVDVLEWEWDKNTIPLSGPIEAQRYLQAYVNPDYFGSGSSGNSTFTIG